MARTSIIGGEADHRSFMGGEVPTWRIGVIAVALVAFMLLAMLGGAVGAGIGVALLAVSWVLTAATARGSIAQRVMTRGRLKSRRKHGTVLFEPYESGRWELLKKESGSKDRAVRAEATRQAAGVRELPDGAAWMGWLSRAAREPGIAWHAPPGRQPYLSVAFAVSGQIRGLESQAATDRAAQRWGRFQAHLGGVDALARSVQTVTRVLPPDSARHQAWVVQNVDENLPSEVVESYGDLINRVDRSTMIQRHYVVLRWPINSQFRHVAGRYGRGRAGWRALMRTEIESMESQLRSSGHENVRPLSAAQLAAVIRHMQDPSHPIDKVKGVDPESLGVASRDEYSSHVVKGKDAEWWHRTAQIRASDLAIGERGSMWLSGLLSAPGDGSLRTVSCYSWVIPATVARRRAKLDRIRDAGDQISRRKKGQMADEETRMRLEAADRRRADLEPGKPHAGSSWIAYVTVSAKSRDGLAAACRHTSEVAAREVGVERLTWMDTLQSAASGCTWPLARGMEPPPTPAGDRMVAAMAGHGSKEEL